MLKRHERLARQPFTMESLGTALARTPFVEKHHSFGNGSPWDRKKVNLSQ